MVRRDGLGDGGAHARRARGAATSIHGAAVRALAAMAVVMAALGGCFHFQQGTYVAIELYVAPPPAYDPRDSADRIRLTVRAVDRDTGAESVLAERDVRVARGTDGLGVRFDAGSFTRIDVTLVDGSGAVVGYGASLVHDFRDEADVPASITIFVSPAGFVVPAWGFAGNQATMTAGRIGHAVTELEDGRVLVTGGGLAGDTLGRLDFSTISRSAEVFDVEAGRFVPMTDGFGQPTPLHEPRAFHTATRLDDGTVLLAGGVSLVSGAFVTTASGEIIDYPNCVAPGTADAFARYLCGVFDVPNLMSEARAHHTATARSDGTVLLAGGTFELGGAAPGYLASADVYAGAFGFAPAEPMGTPRAWHAATLLSDGTVLVTGGLGPDEVGEPEVLASAEVFGPVEWTSVGAMVTPRAAHAANLATNEDGSTVVVVTGGFTTYEPGNQVFGEPSALVETFVPGLGFDPARSRNFPGGVAVAAHTATTLPDGRVVILGGQTGGNASSILVATVASLATGPVITVEPIVLFAPRAEHRTALLPSGQLLLIGGFAAVAGNPITEAASEVYAPDY
jgi:hypothetical protein